MVGERKKKERRKKEELLVPCNSASHLFPLLWGVLYSIFIFGFILWLLLYCYDNIYAFVVGILRGPRSK